MSSGFDFLNPPGSFPALALVSRIAGLSMWMLTVYIFLIGEKKIQTSRNSTLTYALAV